MIDSDSETEAAAPKRARVNAVDKPTMRASFLPSTKMQYMMKKLLELAETHPDDKVRRDIHCHSWTDLLCRPWLSRNGRALSTYAQTILTRITFDMSASKDQCLYVSGTRPSSTCTNRDEYLIITNRPLSFAEPS